MNIVTGYTGVPHITANEAQALNQGVIGTGNYVLNVGNKFAATLADVNTVTIQDGEGMMQGVQFRIAPGETEDVTIENGTSGYNRIDLICARYTKDAQTGVEAVNLVVIQGTPNASTPAEPSYNTGNILTGSSPVDFPLYKVTLTELVPSIEVVFEPATPGSVYELDCVTNGTYDNGSRLFVIPSAKLMVFNVYATIPANTTTFIQLASYTPFIRGLLLLTEIVTIPLTRETSGGTISGDAYAVISQPRTLSDSSHTQLLIYSNSMNEETKVYGTIVVPYSDYDPNYPLSSGTLLS